MAKPITILSIDGGGVRGIIPGVMLDYLESELQKLEQSTEARLADYFDVISGTSTGGLIATMISASNDEGRPLYAADEIVPFYKEHCPKIFPKSGNRNERKEVVSEESARTIGTFLVEGGPWYDGKYLHQLARDTLGEKRLHDITLTKVVIPTYDIKKLLPVVFSSFRVENGATFFDALLSDICISTSAAPVYLPAYKFSNEGFEFNCIDGGVAANNPTLAAITEAVKNRSKEDKRIDLNDFQLLVLSLGTGANKEEKYNADLANTWWSVNWLLYPTHELWDGNNPLPEIMFTASSDIVDNYCTTFLESFGNYQNYLRVQDDKLPRELSRLDNGTLENLNELEKSAKDLLNKPVRGHEFEGNVTNGDALKEFAQKLYNIKHPEEANSEAKAKAK
ncbi:hypothetical protein UlMin_033153 [Ulmus minor]